MPRINERSGDFYDIITAMQTFFRWFKRLVALAILAGIAYAGYMYFSSKQREAEVVRYRTAPVVRTDVFRTVEATGTVQPIKEVEVGAQVNGRVLKLFVDYNSTVTNGQVVALIDPLVYEANYKSALGELHANQANVKKCEAQLVLAEKTLVRKEKLSKREMAPVADYDSALEARDTAVASLAAAKASVERSEASVSQAKANLGYCTIVSPPCRSSRSPPTSAASRWRRRCRRRTSAACATDRRSLSPSIPIPATRSPG